MKETGLARTSIRETARRTPVMEETDVLVVGGGPAGFTAAIAAAREGARVLLVEQQGFLGGMAALGVPFQGFHNGLNRIVGGIPWELVEGLVKCGASAGPWFYRSGEECVSGSVIAFDTSKLRTVLLDFVKESGAKLLLYTSAAGPILEANRAKGIFLESKSGRQSILAKIVIDASGDGDVAARAGAQFEKGNAKGFLQPVTLLFRLHNVNIKKFLNDVDAHPADYGIHGSKVNYWEDYRKGYCMSIGGLREICQRAVENGDYTMPNPCVSLACLSHNNEVLVNMAHVKLVDATDNKDLTRADTEGMESVWKAADFLRKYLVGFQRAQVSWVAPTLGIRETRRIIGEYTLTEKDALPRKKFDDRICMGGRGVDIHDPTPDNSQPPRQMYMRFPEGYYIPFRSLVPRKLENLLIAGRCISVGYRMFGSTRVMAQCMATGQAAGTAAALAVANNLPLKKLDVKQLQSVLKKNGAIID